MKVIEIKDGKLNTKNQEIVACKILTLNNGQKYRKTIIRYSRKNRGV